MPLINNNQAIHIQGVEVHTPKLPILQGKPRNQIIKWSVQIMKGYWDWIVIWESHTTWIAYWGRADHSAQCICDCTTTDLHSHTHACTCMACWPKWPAPDNTLILKLTTGESSREQPAMKEESGSIEALSHLELNLLSAVLFPTELMLDTIQLYIPATVLSPLGMCRAELILQHEQYSHLFRQTVGALGRNLLTWIGD